MNPVDMSPLLCLCLQVVNKPDSHGGSLDWTKICEKSSKVITFIDLAGHEKYLKTTVFGMTGHLPDFCMLMVRRGRGWQKHSDFGLIHYLLLELHNEMKGAISVHFRVSE